MKNITHIRIHIHIYIKEERNSEEFTYFGDTVFDFITTNDDSYRDMVDEGRGEGGGRKAKKLEMVMYFFPLLLRHHPKS